MNNYDQNGGYPYYNRAYAEAEEQRLKEEKRRKNRIYNTVIYCLAGVLVLTGIIIILRSETTIFNKNSAAIPDATFPPLPTSGNGGFIIDVPTPASTEGAAVTDPSAATPTYPPPTQLPYIPPEAPVSIYFNGYNVSCSVLPVGEDPDGTMETVPSHNIAGWYKYGPAPNQEGNCIIAGHNRYAGQLGSFSLLHNGLKVGDRVTVVLENGTTCFYVVRSIDTYHYTEVPAGVMDVGGETRLTLITCLGDYNYDLQMSVSRVVAVCIPVE